MKAKELEKWLGTRLPKDILKEVQTELDRHMRENDACSNVSTLLVNGEVAYQQTFYVDEETHQIQEKPVRAYEKRNRLPDFPPEMNPEENRGIYEVQCGACGSTLWESDDK